MKKVLALLLIALIVSSSDTFAFAHKLEQNNDFLDTENFDSVDYENTTDSETENEIASCNIGAGTGTYDHEESVFLKNYASYYFLQLKDNFGNNCNSVGTCSYVAAAMLLSYYDSYWDDNIIAEKYDKPIFGFSLESPLSENSLSPGIRRIYDSDLIGRSYEDVIQDYSDTHFHIELLRIGRDILNMGYGIFPWDIEDLLDYYLYTVRGYTHTDVSIVYKNWADFEGSKQEYIKEKVKAGIPVIVSGGTLDIINSGHTYIIYDYDEVNDELYCHMGWYDKLNSDGEYLTTHVAFSSIAGTLIGGAITLEFTNDHCHSDNYIDSYGKEHCSCDFPSHELHNCTYQSCSNTQHTYTCRCSLLTENTFNHEYSYESIGNDTHKATCIQCGYTKEMIHVADTSYKDPLGRKHLCKFCGIYYFSDITPIIRNQIPQEIIKE